MLVHLIHILLRHGQCGDGMRGSGALARRCECVRLDGLHLPGGRDGAQGVLHEVARQGVTGVAEQAHALALAVVVAGVKLAAGIGPFQVQLTRGNTGRVVAVGVVLVADVGKAFCEDGEFGLAVIVGECDEFVLQALHQGAEHIVGRGAALVVVLVGADDDGAAGVPVRAGVAFFGGDVFVAAEDAAQDADAHADHRPIDGYEGGRTGGDGPGVAAVECGDQVQALDDGQRDRCHAAARDAGKAVVDGCAATGNGDRVTPLQRADQIQPTAQAAEFVGQVAAAGKPVKLRAKGDDAAGAAEVAHVVPLPQANDAVGQAHCLFGALELGIFAAGQGLSAIGDVQGLPVSQAQALKPAARSLHIAHDVAIGIGEHEAATAGSDEVDVGITQTEGVHLLAQGRLLRGRERGAGELVCEAADRRGQFCAGAVQSWHHHPLGRSPVFTRDRVAGGCIQRQAAITFKQALGAAELCGLASGFNQATATWVVRQADKHATRCGLCGDTAIRVDGSRAACAVDHGTAVACRISCHGHAVLPQDDAAVIVCHNTLRRAGIEVEVGDGLCVAAPPGSAVG